MAGDTFDTTNVGPPATAEEEAAATQAASAVVPVNSATDAAQVQGANTPAPVGGAVAATLDGEVQLQEAREPLDRSYKAVKDISETQDKNNQEATDAQADALKKQAEVEKLSKEGQEAVAKFGADLTTSATKFIETRKIAETNYNNAQDAYLRSVSAASTTSVYNWWAQAPTGAKILGLISQAAAGAANFLAGQPGAPTPLDRIIEQDLQYQMQKRQEAKDSVAFNKGIFQDMKQALSDTVTAYSASMEIAYTSTMKRMEQLKLASNDARVQANLDKAIADLQANQADKRNKVLDYMKEAAFKKGAIDSGLVADWAKMNASFEAAQLKAGASGALELQKGASAITGVEGSEYLSEKKRDELNAFVSGAEDLRNAAQTVDKNPDLAAEEASKVTFALKGILGTGNISEGEYDIIANIVGIPLATFKQSFLSGKLDTAIKDAFTEDKTKLYRLAAWAEQRAERMVKGTTLPGGRRLQINWKARE